MKRSHFIEKYRLSDEHPYSIDTGVIAVNDLIKESGRFLEDNFYGLFKVKSDLTVRGHICIALDQTVYFFKLLVFSIRAKSLINVNFSCNNSDLLVNISAADGLPIDGDDLRILIKSARNAGFEANKTTDGLVLSVKLLTLPVKVFAKSIIPASTIRKKLRKIFFGK